MIFFIFADILQSYFTAATTHFTVHLSKWQFKNFPRHNINQLRHSCWGNSLEAQRIKLKNDDIAKLLYPQSLPYYIALAHLLLNSDRPLSKDQ